MPKYSKRSAIKLAQCDERLQRVFNRVLEIFDHTILCGHRDQDTQEDMFEMGRSQLHWPDSKHNALPSRAVDAIPYPINWKDREQMTLFAGVVIGTAREMGYTVTSGASLNDNNWHNCVIGWDGSGDTTGLTFWKDATSLSLTPSGSNITSGSTKEGAASFSIHFYRANGAGGAYYEGYSDEWAVWDTELTEDEVKEIQNGTPGSADGIPLNLNAHSQATNLISWWRMGDDAADDLSGNDPPTNHTTNVITDVSASAGFTRSNGSCIFKSSDLNQITFSTEVPA